jgi:hypothetical protein
MVAGDALIKMAEPWGVANALPTWVPGGNPCVGWEGVVCNSQGFVLQLYVSGQVPLTLCVWAQGLKDRLPDRS